ncbi:MAG: hypothetical protein A3J93_03675 [Candidatus Magasanikbacteria bacterium RIFOXYC2_FULL_42_28]|uniref:Uncharacterized protein n=1 Tax=Candidatus Magasanikbacteria bacterium RIFOXYC2_FULL_42_28 TaxID=1798704 RepID=A0A1F6NUK1_9BACT|nr:MAG: hypothetical protein A3J93_03675 [Candidatus Magasanikbacteria bacterium RIFOXYC2_FULL_42_28]
MSAFYFLQSSSPETWKQRVDLLIRIGMIADDLFLGKWENDSVWGWSKFLVADLAKFNKEKIPSDWRYQSFFYALVGFLDFSLLEKITNELDKLARIKIGPASKGATIISTVSEEWNALGDFLDLTPAGGGILRNKVSGLTAVELEKLTADMRVLADDYNDFRIVFKFVATALLYHIPPVPAVDLDGFKYAVSVQAEQKKNDFSIDHGLLCTNFLGWSFLKRDEKVMRWAAEYLRQFSVESIKYDSPFDLIFLIGILHLAFYNFTGLSSETQIELIKKFTLKALCWGVPLDKVLLSKSGEGLSVATGPKNTRALFTALENSEETMNFGSDKVLMNVGQFVKQFLLSAHRDYGGYAQTEYVGDAIRENHWPDGARVYLFALLKCCLYLKAGSSA